MSPWAPSHSFRTPFKHPQKPSKCHFPSTPNFHNTDLILGTYQFCNNNAETVGLEILGMLGLSRRNYKFIAEILNFCDIHKNKLQKPWEESIYTNNFQCGW